MIVAIFGLLSSLALSSGASDGYQPSSNATTCPDYSMYSTMPQGNNSAGRLGLPFMRPSPECRTFVSPAQVILDMYARLKDPDLARLFENTFPSTLDTTVKYFDQSLNLAFIITGDITAQWLRDTGNQFAHLYKLLPQDKNLQSLVKAVINTESRYISQYPYCGSFQPPPESGLAPSHNGYADLVVVNPPVDNQTVFECKYELDSLCGFLKISRSYYANTNDSSFINENWNTAMAQILTVIHDQMQGSWDADFNFVSYYNWTGTPGSDSGPVTNNGNGEPKNYTGLVGTHHRPSDDICVFTDGGLPDFLTPANAMLSAELYNIGCMLEDIGTLSNISSKAKKYSASIRQAVYDHGIASNGIFAYEVNGFGSQYIMDDANVPSLVSLPYLGFLDRSDSLYQKTKSAMFSRVNPYYAAGETFDGIGGPHVNATYPWPMSQITGIFGSDDDDEIMTRLYTVLNNTNGLGLIHESINIYNTSDYTRPWFAWANSYFAEMVLDLASRKPGLIFQTDEPYVIGQADLSVMRRIEPERVDGMGIEKVGKD